MKASIVLGLSYGDEGKGRVTSFLCSNPYGKSLVIRFNGGHQAGHAVVHEGHEHVFSSFGSGTLQGMPTYLSRFCTFYPTAVVNEYKELERFKPVLYVDPLCPVTTPFDIITAQKDERDKRHGSCGVGFGQTIKRHEDGHYKLYVQDLFYPVILEAKLNNIIHQYYGMADKYIIEHKISFLEDVEKVKQIIFPHAPYFGHHHNFIFEGAQGIMLDMDFGFFPNVTRSNTTSKNALQLIKEFGLESSMLEDWQKPEIYYVSRVYQTRHGNGFMTNEALPISLTGMETERNISDEWQGEFRTAPLDINMLNYALACDYNFSSKLKKHLVLTCLDQVNEDAIPFTYNNVLNFGKSSDIFKHLNTSFESVIISKSREGNVFRILEIFEEESFKF